MKFPLWPIRQYTLIFEERGYKCIQTHKNRYVLDYLEPTCEDYVSRRIQLLGDKSKPYSLYPIYFTIKDTAGLLQYRKHTSFYDGRRLVKWNKTKFYKVYHHRIRTVWEDDRGKLHCTVFGTDQVINLPYREVENEIISLVKIKGRYYFLDYGTEPKRVKL